MTARIRRDDGERELAPGAGAGRHRRDADRALAPGVPERRPARSPQFNLPGVDKAKGTVHGVPAVMASLWGKHLGVIALQPEIRRQALERSTRTDQGRGAQRADATSCCADPAIAALVARRARGDDRLREDAGRHQRLPHVDLFRRCRRRVGDRAGEPGAGGLCGDATWRRTCRSTRSCRCCRCRRRSRAASAGVTDYTDVQGRAAGAEQRGRPVPVSELAVCGESRRRGPEGVAGERRRSASTRSTRQRPSRRSWSIQRSRAITSTRSPRSDVSYEIDVTQPPGKRIRKLALHGAAGRAGTGIHRRDE